MGKRKLEAPDPRYSHGPVKVIYSKDNLAQVDPMNRAGRYAAKLRAEAPKSEQLLLRHLKQRRPDMRLWFQHVIAGYIADFVIPEYMLVIEIDGPHHANRKAYDRLRAEHMRAKGYRTIRFPAAMCYREDLRDRILQVIENKCQELSAQHNQPLAWKVPPKSGISGVS